MLVQAKAEGMFELFFLDLSTGLRRGELLGLQWDDVDFRKKNLHVRRQVNRVDGKLAVNTPKTKRSARPVPLSDFTLYVLAEYKKSSSSKWIFPSPVNPDNPREPSSVRKRLSDILERAGCKHVRFHDLRHTFATMALENGIDIKTLAEILGHNTVATTINTYTHSTAEMQAAAAQKIDRAIAGVEAAEEEPTETADTPSEEAPAFVPAEGKYRKRGTGYVKQLSANCWQGRYTPRVDGKRVSYNVYGATEAECEAKLAEKIKEVKAEMGRM